jgi:hypothetical protein
MRKINFTLAAMLLGSGLLAQHKESQNILEKLLWDDKMLNIMIDTRVDYQTDYTNGNYTNSSFQSQTFKLWLVGEIVPGIRYRVRHRLNKAQVPLAREAYSSATDQAWLAFDIGKHWTITAGKQSVQLGTFEYDYNPADIYMGTMCFNDLDAYKTGVNVAYKFLGQVLNLQVFNSDNPQFASEEYKNKAIATSVMWEGNLFKDVIKTRVGYTAFQHERNKFYQWITPGIQFNIGKFTAEADYYLGNRNMDYGQVVGNDELGTRYVRDQSIALNFKYDFGIFKPFIKGVWSQRYDKDYKEGAYDNSGIQAVLEVYPFSGIIKDLRFHLMYSYNETDFKGRYNAMSKQDTHSFLIGVRWLFKAK